VGSIFGAEILSNPQFKRKQVMKNTINSLVLSFSKVNRQHVQLLFVILSLTMLVLGVGAPEDGGNIGR
jgi:hypothetical protein